MIAAALASSPPVLPGFLNALSSPLQHYGVWAIGLLIMLEHFGGRALALRWGKYVFLTEERLNKAEGFFDRRGAIVITFARFVEGLRQANGIIAGITGMHWLRFLIFNAIGAALWVGTWVSLGYVAGNHIGTIYHYITLYSYYALIALAVLIVGYIVWRLRRRRRRLALVVARQVSEAHESRTTGEAAGVMPDKHEADGAGSDKHEAAEAAPGTHQAEAAPDANEASGPAPDANEASGPAPGNHEVTRAPGEHEAVQAAPDDEAAGPAPTEHAAGRHGADRHAPETS